MRIDLEIDVSRLRERLGPRADKRIAFAVVNAINETAKTAQRAVQLRVQDEFTIRKPFVLRQAAIIDPFANVARGRPFAEIRVGQRRRLLLPMFEAGGVREPFKGRQSVAVPVEARPTKAVSIPEELHVQRLELRRPKATTAATRRSRRRGESRRVFEGKSGTYLIPRVGIFQRVAAAASRVLYVLARPFRLEPRLKFVDTVASVARRVFAVNLRRQVGEALEFHRRRR